LEEAVDAVGLSGPGSRDASRVTECGSESSTLAKSAVLNGTGEE